MARILVGDTANAKLEAPWAIQRAVSEALTVFDASAQYARSYQSGQWDGNIRFMRYGSFLVGFVERVRRELDGIECAYTIHEPAVPALTPWLAKGHYTLRDYQEAAVAEALARRRIVIQAPTGAGKTLVGAEIVRRIGHPTLWLCHTKALHDQTLDVLSSALNVSIASVKAGRLDSAPLTVALVQTLARVPVDSPWFRQFRVLVVDEAHHQPAATWMRVTANVPARWRIGLSGTPPTDTSDVRAMRLEGGLGPVFVVTSTSELIAEGHLPEFSVTWLMPPDDSYLSYPRIRDLVCPGWRDNPLRLKRLGTSLLRTTYDLGVVANDERNKLVLSTARNHARQGQRVLVLCQRIVHAQRLHAWYTRVTKLDAWVLDGEKASDSDVLRDTITRFRTAAGGVLFATPFMREGVDIPEVDVLILAGGGESSTAILQSVGRALRGTQRKTVYDVWDGPGVHEKDYLRNHAVSRRDLYTRHKIEQKNPPK